MISKILTQDALTQQFELKNPLKFSLYLCLRDCKLHQPPLGRGSLKPLESSDTRVSRSDLRQRSVSPAWLLNHVLARNMIYKLQ